MVKQIKNCTAKNILDSKALNVNNQCFTSIYNSLIKGKEVIDKNMPNGTEVDKALALEQAFVMAKEGFEPFVLNYSISVKE